MIYLCLFMSSVQSAVRRIGTAPTDADPKIVLAKKDVLTKHLLSPLEENVEHNLHVIVQSWEAAAGTHILYDYI